MDVTIQTKHAENAGYKSLRRRAISTFKRRFLHPFLFLLTIVTTCTTGAVMSFLQHTTNTDLRSLRDLFTALFIEVSHGNNLPLIEGIEFTFALLVILAAHEMGHYFACRYYGVEATLPYFLPAPPGPFTPFGTFGAAIKMKSPIPSRRALFDIGIAGPIAGFCFLLPIAFMGAFMARPIPPPPAGTYQYNDPLLFILISKAFGLAALIEWNPFYWAAWAGLLITALNLFPFAQLDGGHVVFALFGPRGHKAISRVTFALAALLLVLDFYLHRQATWLMWVGMLYVLSKLGHPTVEDGAPLGRARIFIACIGLLLFILSFIPFPIGTT